MITNGSYAGDNSTSRIIYPTGSGTLLGIIITKPGENMGVVAPFVKGNQMLIYGDSTVYNVVTWGTNYIAFSGLTSGTRGDVSVVNASGYTYYYLAFWG